VPMSLLGLWVEFAVRITLFLEMLLCDVARWGSLSS
jgi:hypothetical protein